MHSLSKEVQNELIKILSGTVQEKIIPPILEAKYFSLILDSTPDVSHIDQMTDFARLVDASCGIT